MRIYIATNYGQMQRAKASAKYLADDGHEIVSTWHEGRHDDLDHKDCCAIDLYDLSHAEALLFIPPQNTSRARGGCHVEFGVAIATGLKIFIIGRSENPNVFHFHKNVTHLDSVASFPK